MILEKWDKNNLSNHIVPAFGRNGWAVKKSDTIKALRIFKTKEEAIAYGTIISNAKKIPLYIHNANGSVACKID
jgi:cupin superfamily acireductone dioxygenase involved in methionine salvage